MNKVSAYKSRDGVIYSNPTLCHRADGIHVVKGFLSQNDVVTVSRMDAASRILTNIDNVIDFLQKHRAAGGRIANSMKLQAQKAEDKRIETIEKRAKLQAIELNPR